MGSKPTPLLRFLPLELFFMRLPSSSSLLLASLAVSSSSSSSLSALAAPAGDGQESLSSSAPVPPSVPPPTPVPPHAPIPHGSDDKMAQPNNYLQARNLVDKVTAPLPVPPELVKAIPDLVHVILDPLIGKDAPKAREEPLGVVKQLVPGKTLRAEDADETGVDDASEDSSSQTETSTTTAAGPQDTSVVAPNRPAGCPSKRSQPPPPSGSGGDEGVSAGGDIPHCSVRPTRR
ncbi:hypothetical protein V8E52_003524 [Russula decolorans]